MLTGTIRRHIYENWNETFQSDGIITLPFSNSWSLSKTFHFIWQIKKWSDKMKRYINSDLTKFHYFRFYFQFLVVFHYKMNHKFLIGIQIHSHLFGRFRSLLYTYYLWFVWTNHRQIEKLVNDENKIRTFAILTYRKSPNNPDIC